MIRKITSIAITCLFLFKISAAQVQPYSFDKVGFAHDIPTRTFPVPNINELLSEDDANVNKDVPYRFGYKYSTNLSAYNSGVKEIMKDGSILWRVGIKCPEAFSINMILEDYQVMPGTVLYAYSADKSYVIGPYTSRDNNSDKTLGTDLVRGGDIIVELYVPFYNTGNLMPRITTVTYGYKDMFSIAKGFGTSGSCNVNINCPQGQPWQDDKRAVAMIIVNGNAACTGTLLGNTSLDATPYFLTANHCYSANVSSWVFRFNWESPTCTPNQNGPTNQTVSGSTLKARYSPSDFCLLQLNSQPPETYNVFYAGWDRQNNAATSGVGIHHPDGDIKKISFYTTPLTTDSWSQNDNAHWLVHWSTAVTEPGSSGSAIFDQNHHVVGQLHGGNSGCTSSDQSDLYGKFFSSWTGGGQSTNRLRDWLDPSNTGLNSINGYYTAMPTNTLDVNLFKVNAPTQYFCSDDSIKPEILFKNEGQNTITSATISYNISGGSPVIYNWTGSLATYQQAIVVLPAFTENAGNYQFNCTITNINGSADQNMSNNSKTTNFQVIDGSKITIELKTDNYPGETSYLLKNSSGDTILYQNAFGAANTVFTKEVCVNNGCYTLIIYDGYGDGICCTQGNGYLKVFGETGALLAQAPQFTTSATMNFCIYTQSPTAVLNAPITQACQGSTLNFTQSSTNYSSLTWKLTGPANNNSTNTAYSYTFNIAGTYTLKLLASNNIGADSNMVTITIFPKPTLTLNANPASSSSASDGSVNTQVNSGTAPFTFTWSNGATTQNLSNLPIGTYTCTVTDSKGCSSSKAVIITAPSSINELIGEDGIAVFPNPTTGVAQINWNRHFVVIDVDVMNALGQKLKSYHYENTDNGSVDLTSLPKGMYFIQMNIGNKVITRRIMVER